MARPAPAGCRRADVTIIAAPFTQLADSLGDSRAANMVMLGALLASARIPLEGEITEVLRRLISNPRMVEIDGAALARGRQLVSGAS